MNLPLPKLDISKAPHPHFVDLLVPILPGGVLGIGMALFCPPLRTVLKESHLDYASITLFVFIAYACGAVLTVVTTAVISNTAMLLGAVIGTALVRRSAETKSRSRVWRIAALQFLGPAYVQELQPSDEAAVLKQRLEKLAQEETPQALLTKVLPAEISRLFGQLEADARWQELYKALTALFYKQPELAYGISVLAAVQSVGITCIILACAAAVPHTWAFRTIGLITIVATFIMFVAYGMLVGQQGEHGDVQLANILRELKRAAGNDNNPSSAA